MTGFGLSIDSGSMPLCCRLPLFTVLLFGAIKNLHMYVCQGGHLRVLPRTRVRRTRQLASMSDYV